MAKDLVCNNEVDMEKERFRSWHEGQEFWFDSRVCKSLFDADPEKYMKTELRAEGEKIEPEQKIHEIGERAFEKSRSHAKAIFSDRKRDLADTANGISKALREASKSLRDQHHEDSARFADKSAEQVEALSARFRDRDADQVISDAEDYVRERPALSIGGALAAGFLMARFMKSGASETGRH